MNTNEPCKITDSMPNETSSSRLLAYVREDQVFLNRDYKETENQQHSEQQIETEDKISEENKAQNEVQQENETENQFIEESDDEFIRIKAAHKILNEAQTYDEQNNYPLALQLYRICVDFLLEELMFADGTEQSQIYLREKCTAIMDRIDLLKTKLDPIPLSVTHEQSPDNLPMDKLESLNLS